MTQGLKNIGAAVVPITTRKLSDDGIVTGILCGDPVAGKALVDRFGPTIEHRVWRLTGGDSEYQDIVQQVFQQLVLTMNRLEDPRALAAWVETVTINVVRKEFRRRSYRRKVSYSPTTVDSFIDQSTENGQQEAAYLVQRAFNILAQMKADERIAFTLRYVEGMPLNDIAVAVDCSLATVKRRILRAKESFMKKAQRDPFLISLIEKDNET